MSAHVGLPSRVERLRHELMQLAIVSLYLFVCFGAIVLYKASVLRAYNINYVLYGAAAIKALVVAKFVLLGQAVRLGEKQRSKPLIYYIAYRVLLFAALILVLTLIEEIVIAWIHGKAISEPFSNRGVWLQLGAQCILLCLILTPYFGLDAISEAFGPDRVRRMFFGPRSA